MSRPHLSGTSSFSRLGLFLSLTATFFMPLCWKSAYTATGGQPSSTQVLLAEQGWTPAKLAVVHRRIEAHQAKCQRLRLALARARAQALVIASCVQTSSAKPPRSP